MLRSSFRACWLGLLFLAATDCTPAGGTCLPELGGVADEPDAGCEWSAGQAPACATGSTGVYGAARIVCAAGPCTYQVACWNEGAVGATLADGGAVSAAIGAQGMYYLPLPPGSFDVCFDAGDYNGGACATVGVTAGQLTRVDIYDEQGEGPRNWSLETP